MNKVYVVGMGPGSYEKMTIEAAQILKECDVIAGYTVYVDLLREHFPDKEFLTTPMKQETKRCRMALEAASGGAKVAMVCSGDGGVYGMAGLMYELAEGTDVQVEVIPGVTAALSGAALLGAPIGHDFCVISLSDLLTEWETIEKRLDAAASSDMVIALYNPASKKRKDHLKKACEIMLRHKSPDTVCGIARNIGREEESCELTSLGKLAEAEVDMFCTVFIGNSSSKVIDGKVITPRGYRND